MQDDILFFDTLKHIQDPRRRNRPKTVSFDVRCRRYDNRRTFTDCWMVACTKSGPLLTECCLFHDNKFSTQSSCLCSTAVSRKSFRKLLFTSFHVCLVDVKTTSVLLVTFKHSMSSAKLVQNSTSTQVSWRNGFRFRATRVDPRFSLRWSRFMPFIWLFLYPDFKPLRYIFNAAVPYR